MNQEIKQEWIAALLSGIRQATGKLRRDDGYCCLGVLCEILKDRVGGSWEAPSPNAYSNGSVFTLNNEGADSYLPVSVRQLAGLDSGEEVNLALMNDGGKSFKEIAEKVAEL